MLLVNPGREQATAAYYRDPSYVELTEALGDGGNGTSEPPPDFTEGRGEEVRLTWLIHDVQIWRLDRVHLTDDGVWVETVTDLDGGGDVYDRPTVWHRPADESALITALTAAGLIGDNAPTSPATKAAPAPARPGWVVAAVGLGA